MRDRETRHPAHTYFPGRFLSTVQLLYKASVAHQVGKSSLLQIGHPEVITGSMSLEQRVLWNVKRNAVRR